MRITYKSARETNKFPNRVPDLSRSQTFLPRLACQYANRFGKTFVSYLSKLRRDSVGSDF